LGRHAAVEDIETKEALDREREVGQQHQQEKGNIVGQQQERTY